MPVFTEMNRITSSVMETQKRTKPVLSEKVKFLTMWMAGMSCCDIARTTGRSATTVYRWINRWRKEGHVNTRPYCGRPRNIYSKEYLHTMHLQPLMYSNAYDLYVRRSLFYCLWVGCNITVFSFFNPVSQINLCISSINRLFKEASLTYVDEVFNRFLAIGRGRKNYLVFCHSLTY